MLKHILRFAELQEKSILSNHVSYHSKKKEDFLVYFRMLNEDLFNNFTPILGNINAKRFYIWNWNLTDSFFFFGRTHGTRKSPGQELNLNHSCELCHSCGNTGSFNPLLG